MSKRKIIRPTPEEDAVINAGIAADADSPELTAKDFAKAKPAASKMMELTKQYRGKQKTPTKIAVSIRLDEDVVDAYKSTGRGWQGRINSDLRNQMSHSTSRKSAAGAGGNTLKAPKGGTRSSARAGQPTLKDTRGHRDSSGKFVSNKSVRRTPKKTA